MPGELLAAGAEFVTFPLGALIYKAYQAYQATCFSKAW